MPAEFTPVERKLIEYAAADYAAQYYGGPFAFGADDAARYVAEGHLRTLVSAHGLSPVAAAVVEHLHQHPELLTLSKADRERGAQLRAEKWQRLITAAGRAFQAADFEHARRLVDDAEMIDPCRNVDGYRRKIDEAAAPVLAVVAGGER
ncbi:hypothetical protein [Nocardia africana]|uniref:Uncharacterized protein n=1 Tax=Nocardia africana TaxID=134964 RepID=A0A379X4V7_9NOCA|nr:hypothetical protein [Nocardia africana]MCC3318459.1 hypothetical protein [Nocardia africana]SUH71956.1 Uncharacterised protein [Nocardia africana]